MTASATGLVTLVGEAVVANTVADSQSVTTSVDTPLDITLTGTDVDELNVDLCSCDTAEQRYVVG